MSSELVERLMNRARAAEDECRTDDADLMTSAAAREGGNADG